MSVFEQLEERGGHQLTLVADAFPGISLYYCELCCSLAFVSASEGLVDWHTSPLLSMVVAGAPHAAFALGGVEFDCPMRRYSPLPDSYALKPKLDARRDEILRRIKENV